MKSQTFTFPTNGNARAKQVAHYLGVHISTVWRYAKRPDFPKPPVNDGGPRRRSYSPMEQAKNRG
ncbi:MAG: helix-turn-helix transcriptional regulator [Varibaculum sp.]